MIALDNVDLVGLRPAVMLKLPDIEQVTKIIFGREAIITSGLEGKHMEGSLHPKGLAIDLRTKDRAGLEIKLYHEALKWVLRRGFDVVLESDHVHVEYDPK